MEGQAVTHKTLTETSLADKPQRGRTRTCPRRLVVMDRTDTIGQEEHRNSILRRTTRVKHYRRQARSAQTEGSSWKRRPNRDSRLKWERNRIRGPSQQKGRPPKGGVKGSTHEYQDGTMEREDIDPRSQRIRKERQMSGDERRPLW